jgi:hypothetical protein
VATVSDIFLVKLSQSIGISYDLKKNALGSKTNPNSALFNLLQISSVLLYGKPLFAVYDDANSFAEITYNTGLNIFQFSIGKVFYKTNLITVPSQSITVASIDDSAGVKYFKFYLDYNDFNLSSTVFSATVESVDTNSIIVDQLPAITYLNNFKQINLNGYLIGVQSINSNTNEIILFEDVSAFTFAGSTVNLIFQPVIKTLTTFATQGYPADISIPESGILLATATIIIDSSNNYSLEGTIDKTFIAYPSYSNPVDFFPNQSAYNSFLSVVNNSLKTYSSVQNYDIESSLINSFINYTNGISTIQSDFDTYWHSQAYKPTGVFQYGMGYQGLQKIDFDKRFKDFWYFNKKTDLTRTLAIFRGDIYGGNNAVGQRLGRFDGSVNINNYIDYANTSLLNNGTFSYGVSAITPSGEYSPIFTSASNFYFNSKINNYISWTSSSISNLLFFHVYKNSQTLNGFEQKRLTKPFNVTGYTLSDTILTTISSSTGIATSNFAIQIKSPSSDGGIIGGIYFNASLLDNSSLTGIQSCIIVDPGQNYISPVVTVTGTGFGAAISLTTNAIGGISSALVVSFGSGYTELPTLTVFDTATNSSGNSAVLLPVLSTLNCGIFTGTNSAPIGVAITTLEPIPIASIPSIKTGINMNVQIGNFIGINTNTYYWAVFNFNKPYSLSDAQRIKIYSSTGFSTAFAHSNNGITWVLSTTASQVAKLGFIDKGSSGTVTSSRGVFLTNDKCATPSRLQIYVPNLDLSSLSFSDVGALMGAGLGTANNLPIQNSMNIYVIAENTITGIQSTLITSLAKGTSRGSGQLLGSATDLYDKVLDVFIEPNLSLGVNFIQNTTIINWTLYDFFTVDSAP